MIRDVLPGDVGYVRLEAKPITIEDQESFFTVVGAVGAAAESIPSSSGILNRGNAVVWSSSVRERSWTEYRQLPMISRIFCGRTSLLPQSARRDGVRGGRTLRDECDY
jgi:hypothetical protein